MSSHWKVLFRLHNLVKIPPPVCVESGDERVFTIAARAIAPDGSFFPGCEEVQASFTPRDILRSPLATTGSPDATFLEVRLDGSSDRCAAATAEWTLDVPVVDVLLNLREWRGKDSVSRVLGPTLRLQLNAADVVRRRKLATHLVGSVLGQLGLSFAVAPSDKAGYRQRLEEFLAQHNPKGLAFVEGVVSTIGEIDTFTKLYRKYGVVDYNRRVEDFFRVYGREHMSQISTLLKEWENREEELLHNLVLENGPEPDSIDTTTRLNAFLHEYNISSSAVEVIRAVEELGDTPRELFVVLTAKYGPEPDPRDYLFSSTRYECATSRADTTHLHSGGSHFGNTNGDGTHLENLSASLPLPLQVPANNRKSSSQDVQLDQSQCGTQQGELHQHLLADPVASPCSKEQLLPAPSTKNATRTNNFQFDTTAMGGHSNMDVSWGDFCDALNRIGRSPMEVYYMREAVFASLLNMLGYNNAERDALLLQWQRRIREAVREESLIPSDAHYDTAKAEVMDAVGLQPLQLDALSVTAVTNREHERRFAARLLTAKASVTERLALVGEYAQLRDIIAYGVGDGNGHLANTTSNGSPCVKSHNTGNVKNNGHGIGDTIACGVAVAVFHRRPFRNWSCKQPTCILVCDVVVGASFVSAQQTKVARTATADFRTAYDSCVFYDSGGGETVAVYDAAQVLPRYIVQCRVDTSAVACPAHPARAVEYFVPEAQSFACSRCVILGAHRGAAVLTVNEAVAQARERLVEHQRAAAQYILTLDTAATELAREENALHTAPRRVAAEREIERIRLEAEERVRAITQALERDESEMLKDIARRREESDRLRGTAAAVAENVSNALQLTAPHDIVPALQRIEAAVELQQMQSQHEHTQEPHPQKQRGLPTQDPEQSLMQGGSQTKGHRQSHSQQNANESEVSAVIPKDATNQSLYEKYLAITEANNIVLHDDKSNKKSRYKNNNTANISRVSSSANTSTIRSMDRSDVSRSTKQEVTRGWALFRQGDVDAAREIWESVYGRYPNDAVGARVRAYIAEAIERDYESAAAWYDTALQRDPHDALTLYNYGVLLEALLGRRQEALKLFDRASALGDTTAARRAQQLRAMIQ